MWSLIGSRGTTWFIMDFSKGFSAILSLHLKHLLLLFHHDLGVWRTASLMFSSLLSLTAAAHFSSFLTYVNTEAPPAVLMGLCLASMGHVLEPVGAVFVQHSGSSWCPLTSHRSFLQPSYTSPSQQNLAI